MFPTIDKIATGVNLRRLMDERNITVRGVQEYLCLGSVQSVYHWINGLSMPTIDNLYALSELFQVTVDELLCGNRKLSVQGSARKDIQDMRIQRYFDLLSKNNVA